MAGVQTSVTLKKTNTMAIQCTSQTVSEDIKAGIESHTAATSGAYSTEWQPFHPHYSGSDLYLVMQSIESGAYGIGDGLPPVNLRQDLDDLVRAWSFPEIEGWIFGCALSTPTFNYEAGTPSGRKCTIAIGAGSWEGTDLLGNDNEAAGLAFIELLNDPDYEDYCTID